MVTPITRHERGVTLETIIIVTNIRVRRRRSVMVTPITRERRVTLAVIDPPNEDYCTEYRRRKEDNCSRSQEEVRNGHSYYP